jgi:tetratricopeptide (TPR) repeat protein
MSCLALSTASASAPTAGSDEAAQQAFRTGVDAARQERWPEALAAFERAYALSPRPVVLINLAGAHVRTGQLVEAAKNYRRVLDEAPSGETTAFKRAAAEVLPSVEARIPHVRLRATGLSPADLVQLDGRPVDAAGLGGDHALDPGEHIVTVQRDGSERARVMFALAERESREIALPLPGPAGAPAAIAKRLDNAGLPRGELADGAGSKRRWWASPWTWALAGAVAAGASVAAVVWLGNRGETFSGNLPPGQIAVP